MKQTTIMLRKIIRLTIETGSLTGQCFHLLTLPFGNSQIVSAIIAILNFALALLPNHPTYYMATAGILGKLYSNSMMAVFNSRMKIGNEANGANSSGHNVSVSSNNYLNKTAIRARNTDTHGHGVNTYEMNGPVAVAVTHEQITFPPTDDWKVRDSNCPDIISCILTFNLTSVGPTSTL